MIRDTCESYPNHTIEIYLQANRVFQLVCSIGGVWRSHCCHTFLRANRFLLRLFMSSRLWLSRTRYVLEFFSSLLVASQKK